MGIPENALQTGGDPESRGRHREEGDNPEEKHQVQLEDFKSVDSIERDAMEVGALMFLPSGSSCTCSREAIVYATDHFDVV